MNSPAQRVLINAPLVSAEPAGPGVHLSELVRAMLSQRPTLELVARHNSVRGRDRNRTSAARIDPRVIPRTTPLPNTLIRATQSTIKFPGERLLAGRYDVYHQLHTEVDPAVPANKLVVTLHDTVALDWPEAEGTMYRHAGRLLRRAAAVITVSTFSKDSICHAFGVDSSRVHVVPNGLDHTVFAPARGAVRPQSSDYLLYVGGNTPRKNVDRLIEAFVAARSHLGRDDLRLVLVGPVTYAEQRLRAALPRDFPRSALEFVGHVDTEILVGLYRGAAALVTPSLYEGFGMPVTEAMACGTRVVAANGSALIEVAGGAATLVEPGSVESITKGIVEVLSETSQAREHWISLGLRRAAEFSWTATAEQTLALYDQVAATA